MDRLCCSAADHWSSSEALNVRHYIGPHYKHRQPSSPQEHVSENDNAGSTRQLVRKLKTRFSRERPLKTTIPDGAEVDPIPTVDQDYDSDAQDISSSSIQHRLPSLEISSSSFQRAPTQANSNTVELHEPVHGSPSEHCNKDADAFLISPLSSSEHSIHLHNMRISERLRLTSTAYDGTSDELTPSVVSRASRRSVSGNYDETAAVWEKAARKASVSNFTLKPMDTEHSFDRLEIPRKGSEPPSPISPSSSTASKRELPSIAVASPDRPRRRQRALSALDAWSRYPSHTRKERNESAGIADDVLVQDFKAHSIVTEGTARGSHDVERLDKNKRAKAKSAMLRNKVFVEFPRLLKSRSLGFWKGERGHRSSIAPGGVLEYPELELLPASEPRMPEASVLPPPSPSPGASEHRVIEFRSPIGSSRYHSRQSSDPVRLESDSLLTATEWANVYRGCVDRRSTEFVSPLEDDRSK